jgi:hypothetical protein
VSRNYIGKNLARSEVSGRIRTVNLLIRILAGAWTGNAWGGIEVQYMRNGLGKRSFGLGLQ